MARTSISIVQGPILGTHIGRYTVTIYGDLTRQELIDVANSLQAAGRDATARPASSPAATASPESGGQ